jgi:hypothetical protein
MKVCSIKKRKETRNYNFNDLVSMYVQELWNGGSSYYDQATVGDLDL